MSLVERAVEELIETRVARQQRENGQIPSVSANDSSQTFELETKKLVEQGFFIPSDKPQRLSQEMRAVKRRLLRRLKFYKPGSRTSRPKSPKHSGRNTVLVTSTSPAEGKTFTSINLALSLAMEDDIKVLLVDADVPRPRVLHHLGLKSTKGLADKVDNPGLALPELILRDKNSSLSILSEGQKTAKASEFFARPELGDTIREISKKYADHLVIIDAPPILAAPGTSLLAQYTDEVVFVVKASQTPEPAVVAALDEVLEYNEQVSLILNYALVPGKFSHYGSYGEYYYQARGETE